MGCSCSGNSIAEISRSRGDLLETAPVFPPNYTHNKVFPINMADDGMLVNFEIPAGAFSAPLGSYKGGHWKDRLAAKRARTGKSRWQPFSEQQDEELVLPGAPPAKRQRRDAGERARMSQPQHAEDREVISSLFTYNAASSHPTEPAPTAAEPETIQPSNAPVDDELSTFTHLGLSPTIAGHLLRKLEIKAPTAIQRKAIQQLCSSHTDAFVQAETGSGKTLAYLLPIVQRLSQLSQSMKDAGEDFNRLSGLFAIVLAPTRELAKQINAVLEGLLSCCHWIVSGIVIGGEKKKSEKARLRKGVNILVATPGRLADHLDNTEVLDISRVRWLVLDEGDRLMELGFEKDIQRLVSLLNLRSRKTQERAIVGLPERRTTVLCSATIKADVDDLANITLKDPVLISVDPEEQVAGEVAAPRAFSAPAQLRQSYAVVPPKQRLVTLLAALKQAFRRKGSVMKCIVFISCADSVDFHFEILTRGREAEDVGSPTATHVKPTPQSRSVKIPQGATISESRTQGHADSITSGDQAVEIFRLHGSLQQATRTSTLKAFTKSTDAAVLVCTDVASRGLDLPNVDLVIEYDPAFSKADNLHRIGRTARAGKDGRAMLFLMPGCEEGYVDILKEGRQRQLTRHISEELLKKGFSAATTVGEKAGKRDWEDAATDFQLDIERWALANPARLEQARRAYQSHIRAYATHVSTERSMFDIKALHLGHLAKAFALRDKPGSLRVPGMRPNGETKGGKKGKEVRVPQKRAISGGQMEDVDTTATDEQEARRRMREMGRKLGGVSEFNLG